MAWLYLFVAGLLEIVWASALKQSAGFTRPLPSIVMAIGLVASFVLLSAAMRTLPLGTSYMVWTGIGAVGAFMVGTVFLSEPLSTIRVIAAMLILAGIVLMKVSDN